MVANEWRFTAEWCSCSSVQWRSAIVALVGHAVNINALHSIGDLVIADTEIGDCDTWWIGWTCRMLSLRTVNITLGKLFELVEWSHWGWWTSHLVNWVNLLSCLTGDYNVTRWSLLLGPSSSRLNYQELEKQYQWVATFSWSVFLMEKKQHTVSDATYWN